MKKIKSLAILLAIVMVLGVGLAACNNDGKYVITLDMDKSFLLEQDSQVDFTQYFKVKDRDGNVVPVTKNMLDLSQVDLSKVGNTFKVTLTIGKSTKSATFIVVEKTSGGQKPNGGGGNGGGTGDDNPPSGGETNELSTILAKYSDLSKWNYAVTLTIKDGSDTITEYYEYNGHNVKNTYTDEDGTTTQYLSYNVSEDMYYVYVDDGEGNYVIYDETSEDFEDLYYSFYLVFPNYLANYTFNASGSAYVADNPNACGSEVLYELDGYTWTRITLYTSNSLISKLVGVQNDGWTETYEFTKYGQVNFTLPNGTSAGGSGSGSDTPTTPTGKMTKQNYNPSIFDRENLQDKLLKVDVALGLPSTGDVKALVVPVQFKGDTITQSQLDKLEIAFNGTSEQTGWESVSSYYYKSSYGKLNLSFDIQKVFETADDANYYLNYTETYQGEEYYVGEEAILKEVLSAYAKDSNVNLADYDANNDGYVDAIYLIYSESVDYANADFFWAFTTWYYGAENETYDGVGAYYYLFAGLDFMDESTENDPGSGYEQIPGMKVNATTYIHETGHLLGLDDYYDYEDDAGCNEGLGSADMMDYNVGDHNVYSKIMLGWITPTIVNDTTTLTIKSLQAAYEEGKQAILIPLDFNNSYFCEYLLIDFYTNTGLNALHASQDISYLYDGASFGVRIYHVSSSANDPFNNDYQSFTDYNNSTTNIALIKLVEADGDTKFASSQGWASESDLWQEGDKLSDKFPRYMRNDGKTLCFDIEIVSVSATEGATIKITFDAE